MEKNEVVDNFLDYFKSLSVEEMYDFITVLDQIYDEKGDDGTESNDS